MEINKWLYELALRPRPDWVRENFNGLDGEWEFQEDRSNTGEKDRWHDSRSLAEKIIVPFCVESEASGIGRKNPPNVVWYKKRFAAPAGQKHDRRTLLNFGAVDYKAKVWLNGRFVGSHTGGYTPFQFDITDFLADGKNVLAVRVSDSHDPRIPRGKQTVLWKPLLIFYTTVTGIWQPVYLETTGPVFLSSAEIQADPSDGRVRITACWRGSSKPARIRFSASLPDGGVVCAETEIPERNARDSAGAELLISDIEQWSPDTPRLYPLKMELFDESGVLSDSVDTYFAFRTIKIENKSILLNGKPLFQKLLLNQGYFPEGHYTPADPKIYRTDIEQAKEMGFNGARLHQKIEDPRFLFWCDALGFLVWEEMPSALIHSKKMRDAVKTQWAEAITRDRNHPCIITWVPFNESWGVKNLLWSARVRKYIEDVYLYTKQLDPTRPVIDNSGFEHVRTDILDIHHYLGTAEKAERFYEKIRDPKNMEFDLLNLIRQFDPSESPASPLAPGAKYEGQPMIISEYGGFGFYKTAEKPLLDNFRDYTLGIARCDLFQGYAYTQHYDTEQEQNGLLTFDRRPKVPLEELRAVNVEADRIFAARNKQ